MSIIKGNILIFLTVFFQTVFVILWQKFDEGSFRRTFVYSRKAGMYYEYKLLAKMFFPIVVVELAMYYTSGYFLDISSHNIWQVIFVMLSMLLIYYMVSNKGAIKCNPVLLVLILFAVLILPSVAIMAILIWGVCLDNYVALYSAVLFVLDVILWYISYVYWRRGDLV